MTPSPPLRWTTKSVRNLAAELRRQGHVVSHETVSELLHVLGYSLQAKRRTLGGTSHPDRDAQFAHLNAAVQLQLSLGQPGHLRGHQEEGTCGAVPQRRSGTAPDG